MWRNYFLSISIILWRQIFIVYLTNRYIEFKYHYVTLKKNILLFRKKGVASLNGWFGPPLLTLGLSESYSRCPDMDMMTSSNGNISVLLDPCEGNSPVNSPHQAQWCGALVSSLLQNKRVSKQLRRWWFEIPSRPLWRHCNGSASHITGPLSTESVNNRFPYQNLVMWSFQVFFVVTLLGRVLLTWPNASTSPPVNYNVIII